jgi:hypothetical protein
MRKIRDVLRLTHALGMSRRLVGEATGIGKTAVGEYVRRAAVAGLSWPILDEIDDAELERRLFPPPDAASSTSRTEPDWSHNHAELKRRGVTLALLWQEYRAEHAQGYAYSWFCERYSDWRNCISPTMRQTHLAGEKLFVDWAGDTMPVFDPTTGEEHCARIVDPQIEAAGIGVCPHGTDRLPELLLAVLGHRIDAMSRTGFGCFFRHNIVLSLMSPPQWRPRCPFRGRGGKAGLSQAVRRTPEARSCTNAVRKRAALTEPRASAEPGTKRGRLGRRNRERRS